MGDRLYNIELSNTGLSGVVYVMDTAKHTGGE